MSFIITLYVREGIVMASDSRLTLSTQQQASNKKVVNLAVGQSDANYKTFLTSQGVGISTYGAADIGGVPIGGYVESFLSEKIGDQPLAPDAVASGLLAYFRGLNPVPATQFHVAGYANVENRFEQQVCHVAVADDSSKQINPSGQQGASWGGESDILARLVQPVGQLDESGKVVRVLPHFQIPWGFFTLQDAVDFATFAIRSTIDALRFMPRAKTVGGPIDVLVIKPTGAAWVRRKELRVTG